MIVWRISKDRYIQDLSGMGASLGGGRWNLKGSPVVYTTGNKALAVLQMQLHTSEVIQGDLYAIPIYIPDNTEILAITAKELPLNWYQIPAPEETGKIGTKWLESKSSLVLEVPDPMIYGEKNYLINPKHSEFYKVKALPSESIFIYSGDRPRDEPTFSYYLKLKERSLNMKDVFICHASEDKKEVVDLLYNSFKSNGITAWYDINEIKWGDSIPEKINDGLGKSRYVIVVISKNFIKKAWPKKEMNAALNIEATLGRTKVLPLMVGTNEEINEILKAFALQNDKLYIKWENNSTPIVNALKELLSNPMD